MQNSVIACLGWGSLVWDHERPFSIRGEWHEDGPPIRVEFVRQSKDCRLTLVLCSGAVEVRSCWAFMNSDKLDSAVETLCVRENIPLKNRSVHIGSWSHPAPDPPNIPGLSAWASDRGIGRVIWTGLPPRFKCEDERIPSADEAVCYLKLLKGKMKKDAEEYVRNAPIQINTKYRRRFESEFGWTPLP